MTINCQKYHDALIKSGFQIDLMWQRNDQKTKVASEFSAVSGIPLVVVCIFLKNKYGDNNELSSMLDTLISFYGYSVIINFDGVHIHT